MDIYTHFLDNKYTKWYFNIILNARQQNRKKGLGQYFENHHIIPKCKPFCGSNDKNNLVLLEFREHFLCHWLLTKMCQEERKYKMLCALSIMTRNNKFISSWMYELGQLYNIRSKLGVPLDGNLIIKREETKKKNFSNNPNNRCIVIFPDRREEITNNLVDFCYLYELSYRSMMKVLRGKRSHHKKFKVYRYLNNEIIYPHIEEKKIIFKYLLIFPDGHQETVSNLKLYCENNKLSYHALFQVLIGNNKQHKGIKIEYI